MARLTYRVPRIPEAPRSIQRGVPLKTLLDVATVDHLARNIRLVWPRFDAPSFRRSALDGLAECELMARGEHLAAALHRHLPADYRAAVAVLLDSLTPAQTTTEGSGLTGFFYLPHGCFIARYGVESQTGGDDDRFEPSMTALHALTQRFTAELAIRAFLLRHPARTLARVAAWTSDPNPHVRRLCSEGTRPRLPWGRRVPLLLADPHTTLPILERLRRDPSLYVRRSVANHVGDIAKGHPEVAFALCERWLREDASPECRWMVRQAVRHPTRQGQARALALRALAQR